MRKYLQFLAAGIVACGMPLTGSAQGYNSFIIELPYEFSVPAIMSHAIVYCSVQGQDRSVLFTFERGIPLENGQAQGALKLGYANFGPADDFLQLPQQHIEALKRAVRQEGFEITLACNMKHFIRDGGGQFFVIHSDTQPSIAIPRYSGTAQPGDGPYFLDSGLSNTKFEATLRAVDNGLAPTPANQTATTTTPAISPGLQSLQTILQGE